MFYAKDKEKLRNFFNKQSIEEVDFKFDFEGSKNNKLMQLPVIILAGGKGTRVKKITKNHPKALLKFYNKPFIEYQINYLIKQNVKEIIVSIRYKPKEFLEYLKKKFDNIKIRLIKDGKDLVGTGGAVKKFLIK